MRPTFPPVSAERDQILAEQADAKRVAVRAGSSEASAKGSQKQRNRLPIGVPWPTRVRSSLSAAESMLEASAQEIAPAGKDTLMAQIAREGAGTRWGLLTTR